MRITEGMSVRSSSCYKCYDYLFKILSGVVMFNHADTEFVVKKGDRIAQLVCEKIAYPELEVLETLDNTERGEAGFGSTGTN